MEYNENGNWVTGTGPSTDWLNAKMTNGFTQYDNYSEQHNNDSAAYEVEWDWKGPQFMYPT